MDSCTLFQWETLEGNLQTTANSSNVRRGYFGSSATLIGHYIWVIGGLNGERSFFLLNVISKEWKPMTLAGVSMSKGLLHSASLYQDKIYLFGLEIKNRSRWSDASNVKTAELFVLDPVLEELREIRTFGGDQRPYAKQAHSTDICERLGVLALFGGAPAQTSNQLWILNLASWTWTVPKAKGQAPSPRERHASCIIDTVLYIYHGQIPHGLMARDGLFMIDLSRQNCLVWKKLDLQGSGVTGRVGPALVYVGSGRLIIFGGHFNNPTNELFVVDNLFSSQPRGRKVMQQKRRGLDLGVGNRLEYTGLPPGPREAPRMLRAFNKLYVLGGSYHDEFRFYRLHPLE